MDFVVIGKISEIQIIARNPSIRERKQLKKRYGGKRWRKLKGTARIQLMNGHVRRAELHWYEAHGVGRHKMKLKRFLDAQP